MKSVFITALITGTAIVIAKLFSILFVYHFFSFDSYVAGVAVAFLLAGAFLFRRFPKINPVSRLSNRELSIFELLGQGMTNKEIAETLFIEVSTVKSHINTLYAKIGCKNRVEAREKWKNA